MAEIMDDPNAPCHPVPALMTTRVWAQKLGDSDSRNPQSHMSIYLYIKLFLNLTTFDTGGFPFIVRHFR